MTDDHGRLNMQLRTEIWLTLRRKARLATDRLLLTHAERELLAELDRAIALTAPEERRPPAVPLSYDDADPLYVRRDGLREPLASAGSDRPPS